MPLDEIHFPEETLAELFTYHAPEIDQIVRYGHLRDAALVFAREIVLLCPASADRTTALRKLRECVMTANASIALEAARAAPEPLKAR